jgi:hypothetical protein
MMVVAEEVYADEASAAWDMRGMDVESREATVCQAQARTAWKRARVTSARRRVAPGPVYIPPRLLRGRTESEIAMAREAIGKLAHVVRRDRINSVRRALQDDGYENALKLEVAVDRLLTEMERTTLDW